jgi:23S rRNA (pseudouridine1915-N3)-methyltransferase
MDKNTFLVLLDEKGKQSSSEEFADFIRKNMNSGRDIVLLIGGAYGFSDEVYSRANDKISLSKMTFSHQLVRLIFAEQLYRAMTIIRGEPYHHS